MSLSGGFLVGDWEVRPREGRILCVAGHPGHETGEVRRVRRKAMDLLCVLAAQAGQVVERDEILSAVWGRTAISDEPLTSTVGELRRLLGEQAGDGRYIETIPKRGYRLLAEVTPLEPPPATAHGEAAAFGPAPETPTAGPRPVSEPGVAPRPAARLAPEIRLGARGMLLLVASLVAVGWMLFRIGTPEPVPVPERSIAVLPFDDLSPEGDQVYFADGLADEMIGLLAGLPQLRVAARNSAFSFRGTTEDTALIAERLKVAHLLTGSVRRSGSQLRVTAQLVDARAGYQLWSGTFERTLEDVFSIQDEIAGEVTRQLRLQLVDAAPKTRETDVRAYTLYLQARHLGHQHTEEGMQRAVELYRKALEIDEDYLPAWSDLAVVYFNMAAFALIPPEEGYALGREAAMTALRIDPAHAPAHDRLGWLALIQGNDLRAATRHYRRALELDPENISILGNAAVLAIALGRLDEAIELLRDVAIRDPVSAISHANLANAYLLARRYPEAEHSIREALTLSPQYVGAHYRLGRILLAQGRLAEAGEAFESEPLEAGQWLGRALLANRNGQRDDSEAALARVRELYGDRAAGSLAQVYADRGEVDIAFDLLETEYRSNGSGGFLEYQWEPAFDSLRDDARWPALLERAGYGETEVATLDFPSLTAKKSNN
jgi:TolB-like protein/DNA-binding winged helix-turn-helix (wHTH) protein/thioredoxin-like negative regulator of GroEL